MIFSNIKNSLSLLLSELPFLFRSGLVAFIDTEADRLMKHGKAKHTDTIKQIRYVPLFTIYNYSNLKSFQFHEKQYV